jgi:hypothetical protein
MLGFMLERICVGFLFTFIMVYVVYTIDASCKNTYYLRKGTNYVVWKRKE